MTSNQSLQGCSWYKRKKIQASYVCVLKRKANSVVRILAIELRRRMLIPRMYRKTLFLTLKTLNFYE